MEAKDGFSSGGSSSNAVSSDRPEVLSVGVFYVFQKSCAWVTVARGLPEKV